MYLPPRAGVAVLLLTILAAALRFVTIDQQSYWYDESVAASLADASLAGLFRGIVDSESTPPLYYVLAWGWAHVFGSEEGSLRAVSAIAGTLVVPVTYAAGRVLCTARIGLAAALLAAVSPILIWYSQEARAYSLLILLGGASVALFALAHAEPSRRRVVSWAVVASAALATHYFAGFVIVAEAVLLFRAHPRLRRLRWALAAVAAVTLALLPLAAVQASHRRLGWVGGIGLGERVGETLQRFVTAGTPSSWAGATGAEVAPYAWLGAVGVLGLAAILVATRASARERSGAMLAGQVAAVGIGGPIAMAVVADLATGGDGDYFLDRNVLGAWVALAVFVAAGLAARKAGVVGSLVLVAVVCSSLVVHLHVTTSPDLQRDDWRSVAAALGALDRTAVVVYPAYQAAALRRQRGELVPRRRAEPVNRVVVVLVGHDALPASFRVPDGFARSRVETIQHFVLLELGARRPTAVGPKDVAGQPLRDADLELLARSGG